MSVSEKMLSGNTVELCYFLKNNADSIDALTRLRCEMELVWLVKEISRLLSTEINIENRFSVGEGTLAKFRFSPLADAIKETSGIASSFLLGWLTSHKADVSVSVKEMLNEWHRLTKDQDLLFDSEEAGEITVPLNLSLLKHRSIFYQTLNECSNVEAISFRLLDRKDEAIVDSKQIIKSQFKPFILVPNELEPILDNEAHVEILAPILKKGGYKWKGFYKGATIGFRMRSREFKRLVQRGKVEFKTGAFLNCALSIERKMTGEGIERVTGYSIMRVDSYFDGENLMETKEGLRYKKQKEAEANQAAAPVQLSLFDML